MATMTRNDLKKIEDYYYKAGYKHWCPFHEELKTNLLAVYRTEPFLQNWTEQDIYEGARGVIMEYFKSR